MMFCKLVLQGGNSLREGEKRTHEQLAINNLLLAILLYKGPVS